ncbi:methylated-DNA--[protein]-cysteine S-methyltransferase [Duganella sp. FT80W]|uniref:Methylated-DNA--protein-cysteine methyltransferase n=1 Tax=Duganella guangzhouensis TaxID=2666084 RepID=A0A6I2L8W5_9BURK|nr:methylated-DNA--[protein]-cysteine S-methyltransferase [Duganella guangzhouensis]MRW93274.1 methylated-DNA--[protein]-cysteine S-methyltransferase [Duganella guangzhouensis]
MAYECMWVDSPVGKLRLVAKGDALAAILWEVDRPDRVKLAPLVDNPDNVVLNQVAQQLSEYFTGRRSGFNVKLDFKGTEFQRKVWAALLTIPFGETRTYGEIAAQIGLPSAVRAVGAANGRNPISIIAPCHRVIGADGTLTGFAGGLKAKQVLLTVEGCNFEGGKAVRMNGGRQ